MKSKDLVYLVLAVVILLVAGYIGYTQLLPKKASSANGSVQVDVIGSIPDSLDSSGTALINDSSKVKDYNSPTDLTGLGNTSLFGQ